ncbi:MAG: hypothetical protein HFG41_04935 [Coprococcus sp.]|nr:hypothetical protein [Coprococcus sp.]
MNRNQLKYLAAAAMVIDHIAWAFVPTASAAGLIMHMIGRLTAPVMIYFVVEGYCHTRNVKRYALRLGMSVPFSWAAFTYFEEGCLPIVLSPGKPDPSASNIQAVRIYLESIDATFTVYLVFGVMYTLFLGLLAIWLWDKGECARLEKSLGIVGLYFLSLFGDWPVFGVAYCYYLFRYREQTREKWTAFSVITALCCMDILFARPIWSGMWMLGIFMAPFLIQFGYNGESGSKKPFHKWFFYIFYPAHLLILGFLKWGFR